MDCLPIDDACTMQNDLAAYIVEEGEPIGEPTQVAIPVPDGRTAYVVWIDGFIFTVLKEKENGRNKTYF